MKKENVFPRYDFNGDGKVHDQDRVGGASGYPNSGIPPFKGYDWTDLEMLQDVWPDDPDLNEGWSKDDLLILLPGLNPDFGSGDIEFRTNIPLGGSNQYDKIKITIQGLPMDRYPTAMDTHLVWTVPHDLGDITVKAEGYKNNAKIADLCFNRSMPIPKLLHGRDTVVTIESCRGGPEFGYASSVSAGRGWSAYSEIRPGRPTGYQNTCFRWPSGEYFITYDSESIGANSIAKTGTGII